jgi:hypothetical protein
MQYSGNTPFIFGNKGYDLSNRLSVLKTDAPYLIDKLTTHKHEIWNECLTYLGINNTNVDKRERLITDEVNSNNELISLGAGATRGWVTCFIEVKPKTHYISNNTIANSVEYITFYNSGKFPISNMTLQSVINNIGFVTPDNCNYVSFPSNQGTVVLSDALSLSASTNENRPVFIYIKGNEVVARKCTWGTSMTSGTNYYLMGATSSTAGLVYNTNVKVLNNAIYASAGFYESSDERLKDFQEDIEVNFSYLHNIPKKYYSWKDDSTYTRHIGTSAQEVQKYYPELVNVDETGYLTMNYDKLSVVALKAIDVLHEEVAELKKENAELKERLARLEELILNK